MVNTEKVGRMVSCGDGGVATAVQIRRIFTYNNLFKDVKSMIFFPKCHISSGQIRMYFLSVNCELTLHFGKYSGAVFFSLHCYDSEWKIIILITSHI